MYTNQHTLPAPENSCCTVYNTSTMYTPIHCTCKHREFTSAKNKKAAKGFGMDWNNEEVRKRECLNDGNRVLRKWWKRKQEIRKLDNFSKGEKEGSSGGSQRWSEGPRDSRGGPGERDEHVQQGGVDDGGEVHHPSPHAAQLNGGQVEQWGHIALCSCQNSGRGESIKPDIRKHLLLEKKTTQSMFQVGFGAWLEGLGTEVAWIVLPSSFHTLSLPNVLARFPQAKVFWLLSPHVTHSHLLTGCFFTLGLP